VGRSVGGKEGRFLWKNWALKEGSLMRLLYKQGSTDLQGPASAEDRAARGVWP